MRIAVFSYDTNRSDTDTVLDLDRDELVDGDTDDDKFEVIEIEWRCFGAIGVRWDSFSIAARTAYGLRGHIPWRR